MDFLKGLNPQQREAVCHFEGPLLILAGAGSGKTRVITHRVCHLIQAHGVPGSAILAVTFTNKAADEMRQRVESLLAGAGIFGPPLLSTFHSFCVRLLRRDGASLADLRPGFTRDFLIYAEDEQLVTLKASFKHVGLDDKFMPYRTALSRISQAKNQKLTPADFYNESKDPKADRLAVIFEQYEGRLRQANALDFDDLLLEAVRLLRHDSLVRQQYNERLRFLLIDEYQDTNRSQYELMRLLSEAHSNVCVVGDEDQSIYGWRGSDIRNILDFERDFPGAVTIRLEQNYRSTQNILKAASAVVARNVERKGKTLWTEAGAGAKIRIYEARDAEAEALFIAEQIERDLAANANDRVAVLYRTNAQSRQIEEALRRYGREYVVVGGLSFYQRAEVKDVLAYLKLLVSPRDPVSLQRIINKPARGIGKTTVEQVAAHAAQSGLSQWEAIVSLTDSGQLPARAQAALSAFRKLIEKLRAGMEGDGLGALLQRIVSQSGYLSMLKSAGTPEAEARIENLDELVNAAAEAAVRGEGPSEFLDHAALVSQSDALDSASRVSLLTMHNAKGLEWPVVFIAGLEEGLFPHARSLESDPQMEEERRLCYVGMTRARKKLVLSWARARRRYGGGSLEGCTRSRFLLEVPPEFTERAQPGYGGARASEVDLFAEQPAVRQAARKNTYTGKTYNSVENISRFFEERGMEPPKPAAVKAPAAARKAPVRRKAAAPKRKFRPGVSVEHPRFGRGLILRREGEGDEAKLTVSFPAHGLKKMVVKYASLKVAK